jgi:hypothetical protein
MGLTQQVARCERPLKYSMDSARHCFTSSPWPDLPRPSHHNEPFDSSAAAADISPTPLVRRTHLHISSDGTMSSPKYFGFVESGASGAVSWVGDTYGSFKSVASKRAPGFVETLMTKSEDIAVPMFSRAQGLSHSVLMFADSAVRHCPNSRQPRRTRRMLQ